MNIDSLIGKILQSEATAAEKAAFEAWLSESEEHRKSFEALHSYWNAHAEVSELREERRWEKTLGKIYEMDNGGEHSATYLNVESKKKTPKLQYLVTKSLQIAAVLLIGVGITWFVYQQPDNEGIPIALETTYLEKSAENGVRKTLKLPDGSTIKLNSGSTLKVPEVFTGATREVFLTGEGYFDVARDEARPFIIHTEKFDITVLGTSFNVNAYTEQVEPSVAVVEGKVKVETLEKSSDSEQAVILEKGQMVTPAQGLAVKQLDKRLIAWTENELIFDTKDFTKITDQLEKWFGVEVKVERVPDMGKGFKGRFKNETLKNVLESMQYTLDIHFDYKQTEQLVVIY